MLFAFYYGGGRIYRDAHGQAYFYQRPHDGYYREDVYYPQTYNGAAPYYYDRGFNPHGSDVGARIGSRIGAAVAGDEGAAIGGRLGAEIGG